jgi:hypothetical protein
MKALIVLAAPIILGTLAAASPCGATRSEGLGPATARVNISSSGAQADRSSYAAGISANGGDTNRNPDVFVRDFGGPPHA